MNIEKFLGRFTNPKRLKEELKKLTRDSNSDDHSKLIDDIERAKRSVNGHLEVLLSKDESSIQSELKFIDKKRRSSSFKQPNSGILKVPGERGVAVSRQLS
jgi:hypothetical protein